jgi:hypothetical protein
MTRLARFGLTLLIILAVGTPVMIKGMIDKNNSQKQHEYRDRLDTWYQNLQKSEPPYTQAQAEFHNIQVDFIQDYPQVLEAGASLGSSMFPFYNLSWDPEARFQNLYDDARSDLTLIFWNMAGETLWLYALSAVLMTFILTFLIIRFFQLRRKHKQSAPPPSSSL